MKINELMEYAKLRLEVTLLLKRSNGDARSVLPLYRVDPEPKPGRPIRAPFVLALSWGDGLSPRFETIADGQCELMNDDPPDPEPDAMPIPWWAHRPAPMTSLVPADAITSRDDGEHTNLVIGRFAFTELAMLEAIAVAAQLRMVCRFVYAKTGEPDADRRVRLTWVGGKDGNLMGGEDLDRPTDDPQYLGKPRSFRVDRVRAIEFRDDAIPEWKDGRWRLGGGGS